MDNSNSGGWRLFAIGLAVRLFGVLLILLGDGSDSAFRKAVVVVGVVLTIGGTTVLRYMLFAPLLGKLKRKPLDADAEGAEQ